MKYSQKAAHKSEIQMKDGIPRLHVDGCPVTPMAFQFMSDAPDITNNIPLPPFMPTDQVLTAMNSAGIKLYFIRAELRDPADLDSFFDKLSRQLRQLPQADRDHQAGIRRHQEVRCRSSLHEDQGRGYAVRALCQHQSVRRLEFWW